MVFSKFKGKEEPLSPACFKQIADFVSQEYNCTSSFFENNARLDTFDSYYKELHPWKQDNIFFNKGSNRIQYANCIHELSPRKVR